MTAPTLVYPFLRYRDAPAAIAWLEQAFGFAPLLVVPGADGDIAHAELRLGDGVVMMGSLKNDELNIATPGALGAVTGGIYAVVADPDQLFQRCRAAGAAVVRPPADTDYGAREFTVRDPEGHLWSFGTYRPHLGTV